MSRKIIVYPDPFLRKPTIPWDRAVDPEGQGLAQIAAELHESLDLFDHGAAMAANQVGIGSRIFVINRKFMSECFRPGAQGFDGLPDTIVNPRVIDHTPERSAEIEGCLSFPGISLSISRWIEIEVEFESTKNYSDDDPKWRVCLTDFAARVFQHEIDHLDGRLFVDDLPHKVRFEIAGKLQRRK